jgi:protein-tyrosine kinase
MSRVYEALKQLETERRPHPTTSRPPAQGKEFIRDVLTEKVGNEDEPSAKVEFAPGPRLVALSDSQSIGAEKFRALATRLENLRSRRELKSLQVTSGTVGEGKTLVAGNLAVTIAEQSGSRVLLIEGDLHRPGMASLFGMADVYGIGDWWCVQDKNIADYLRRMKDLSLWFIGAGSACKQPSQILRSPRFAQAFAQLSEAFDWIIVDSAPMLPTITANLWSRLVDGTLLVVREGVASGKELMKGIDALDNPKLIGVVLNEISELKHANYPDYSQERKRKN